VYAVFLDVQGACVLVVGGGRVAERKVAGLVDEGAQVALVSPTATAGLRALAEAGRIRWHRRHFSEDDLACARLVFAATDSRAVNARVARAARARGIWVNVADSAEESSFLVPSVVRRGALEIAVSTGGKSPLVARQLRQELAARYGDEYGPFLDLLGELREMAEQSLPTEAARRALYTAAVESDALALIRRGQSESARRLVLALFEEQRRRSSATPSP
jgi:siroheme synthase-like protein